MDDQRIGAAFRAARIRRGWTQVDLAGRSGVSASLISSLERGHVDTLSVRTLRRIAARLEMWLSLTPRMRAGDLERLLNAGHAALHEELAKYLAGLPGWVHAPEVSFAVYAERGIIDILAFHETTGSLLVIELKTALVSLEDLLGTMDVRMRLALRVARERGWNARTVSGWVVIADTRTNRRRVAAHRSVLRSAFAAEGRQMRAWLRRPVGEVRALSFWTISNGGGAGRLPALRRRVRHARGPSQKAA